MTTGNNQTEVEVFVASTYIVTILKKVTLDGQKKTGSYTVSVAGDITATEQVSVTLTSSVTLTQSGKDDITATIS